MTMKDGKTMTAADELLEAAIRDITEGQKRAIRLLNLGWHPLPLPSNRKSPPPTGLFGYKGRDIQYPDDILSNRLPSGQTRPGLWDDNLATRMPQDVFGLDIDNYKKRCRDCRELVKPVLRCECSEPVKPFITALENLRERVGAALEDKLRQALKSTWVSTGRGKEGLPTGIYFFQLPPGTTFDDPPLDIDYIQRHQRYAVIAPSRVYDEEAERDYVWITPEGEVTLEAPSPTDLPFLAPELVVALKQPAEQQSSSAGSSSRKRRPFDPNRNPTDFIGQWEIGSVISSPGQYQMLSSIAAALVRRGLSDKDAAAYIWDNIVEADLLPNDIPTDPWTERDIRNRVERARRYIDANPSEGVRADDEPPLSAYDDPEQTSDTTGGGGPVDDDADSKAWRPYVWAERIQNILKIEAGLVGDDDKKLYHYDFRRKVHTGTDTETGVVPRKVKDLWLDRKSGLPKPAGGPKPAHYADVVRELRTMIPRINANPNLFGFKDATVDLTDLDNPKIAEPSPDDCLTHRMRYKYDRDAVCPTWDRFLEEVLPDEQYAYLIDQFLAAAIADRVPPKGALFAYGGKDTGKSTLAETLRFVLGGQTSAVTPQDMGDKSFHLRLMIGKRANIVGDVNTDDIDNTSVFKSATSGKNEVITADVKHKDQLEIVIKAPSIFFGNDKPKSRKDKSDAFVSRQISIPMVRVFTEDEQNDDLNRELEAEAAGIFNRGLAAYKRMIKEGWFWNIPDRAREAMKDDIREAAQHQAWVEDRILDDPEVFLTTTDAWDDFRQWGTDNGFNIRTDKNDKSRGPYLWARQTFINKVKTLWGPSRKRRVEGKTCRGWDNKALLPAGQKHEDLDGTTLTDEEQAKYDKEQAAFDKEYGAY